MFCGLGWPAHRKSVGFSREVRVERVCGNGKILCKWSQLMVTVRSWRSDGCCFHSLYDYDEASKVTQASRYEGSVLHV